MFDFWPLFVFKVFLVVVNGGPVPHLLTTIIIIIIMIIIIIITIINRSFAASDLFHMLTQSIKFYIFHYHILKSTDV